MAVSIADAFLLALALKSVALLGAAWIIALLFRRRSAATRHLVWSAAFVALLALPILSVALPALRMNLAGALLTTRPVFQANVSAAPLKPAAHREGQTSAAPSRKSQPWLPDFRIWLALVWTAGTSVSFAQMFIGWISMLSLRRRANPLAISALVPLAKLIENEKVDLLEAPHGSMPIAYGFFHPAIFLPADIAEWHPERRRIVLLHELAHVRRGDTATQLLARTALALYWWNPLAWIAWRESLKERERAADDLVLTAGATAPDYATHLLEIARSMQLPVAFCSSAIAMARRSQLEGRLLSILDPRRDRRSPKRGFSSLAWLLAIGMTAPLAAVHAQNDAGQGTAHAPDTTNSIFHLIASADLARDRQQYDQARSLYTTALASLHSGPEAATVLVHLGTVELARKNPETAIRDFENASIADPAKTGEARMWTAISEQRRNNLDIADALYQSALTAQDPNSAAAATTMELYAQLLLQQGRKEEAARIRHQAANIRRAQASQILSTMQASASDVYRVGMSVTAPVLTFKVEPEYTEEARIAKYQGSVLLYAEIGSDGIAHRITAIRTLGFGLGEKAVEAVSRWRFKPGTKDGEPVTVAATIEVNFRLK
jgi:TonB family protein